MKVVNFEKIGLHPEQYQLKIEDENTYLIVALDEIEVRKIAAQFKKAGF